MRWVSKGFCRRAVLVNKWMIENDRRLRELQAGKVRLCAKSTDPADASQWLSLSGIASVFASSSPWRV